MAHIEPEALAEYERCFCRVQGICMLTVHFIPEELPIETRSVLLHFFGM